MHLREHPQPTKLALLCALLHLRERELTDALAQLLISTVHRINARSEEKVITALVKDFKRVTGKETLLRKIAEASLGTPDDTVREVIFPVVGGEATLQELVAEYRQKGTEYQRQKRKVFKASYSNHHRRGLIRLLGVLEFRSNNTAHQPVIDALALIVRYAHSPGQYYPAGEHVIMRSASRPRCVYSVCMARVNVYLPDDLAERAKLAGISLSAVTQDALHSALAAIDTDAWLDRLDRHSSAEVEHDRMLAALDEAREDFGARSAG